MPSALGIGAIRWRGRREASTNTGSVTTTLYLIRHAQALPRRDQEEPEWALSALGEEQARGLVPVLGELGLQRVFSSPFRRCRDTLTPFARATGLEVVLDPGLRERRLAREWISDFRDVWRRSWEDFSFAVDGGESSETCQTRIAAAVEAIVERRPGETIGVCSHGNAIGLFLNYVDPSFGLDQASAIRTPEISKVMRHKGLWTWQREFTAGPTFEALATDFRATPGIVA